MSNEEFDEFEAEMKAIEEMFPTAKFSISIPLSKMNDILTTEPSIIIGHWRCSCYKRRGWKPYCITLQEMSYKNIINELIKQKLKTKCHHRHLEAFILKDGNYSMFFGS